MKTWYKAVCDEHKEYINIFVNNPETTLAYLGDKSEMIELWLSLHRNCKLRLIHSDQELDEIHNRGGYSKVRE